MAQLQQKIDNSQSNQDQEQDHDHESNSKHVDIKQILPLDLEDDHLKQPRMDNNSSHESLVSNQYYQEDAMNATNTKFHHTHTGMNVETVNLNSRKSQHADEPQLFNQQISEQFEFSGDADKDLAKSETTLTIDPKVGRIDGVLKDRPNFVIKEIRNLNKNHFNIGGSFKLPSFKGEKVRTYGTAVYKDPFKSRFSQHSMAKLGAKNLAQSSMQKSEASSVVRNVSQPQEKKIDSKKHSIDSMSPTLQKNYSSGFTFNSVHLDHRMPESRQESPSKQIQQKRVSVVEFQPMDNFRLKQQKKNKLQIDNQIFRKQRRDPMHIFDWPVRDSEGSIRKLSTRSKQAIGPRLVSNSRLLKHQNQQKKSQISRKLHESGQLVSRQVGVPSVPGAPTNDFLDKLPSNYDNHEQTRDGKLKSQSDFTEDTVMPKSASITNFRTTLNEFNQAKKFGQVLNQREFIFQASDYYNNDQQPQPKKSPRWFETSPPKNNQQPFKQYGKDLQNQRLLPLADKSLPNLERYQVNLIQINEYNYHDTKKDTTEKEKEKSQDKEKEKQFQINSNRSNKGFKKFHKTYQSMSKGDASENIGTSNTSRTMNNQGQEKSLASKKQIVIIDQELQNLRYLDGRKDKNHQKKDTLTEDILESNLFSNQDQTSIIKDYNFTASRRDSNPESRQSHHEMTSILPELRKSTQNFEKFETDSMKKRKEKKEKKDANNNKKGDKLDQTCQANDQSDNQLTLQSIGKVEVPLKQYQIQQAQGNLFRSESQQMRRSWQRSIAKKYRSNLLINYQKQRANETTQNSDFDDKKMRSSLQSKKHSLNQTKSSIQNSTLMRATDYQSMDGGDSSPKKKDQGTGVSNQVPRVVQVSSSIDELPSESASPKHVKIPQAADLIEPNITSSFAEQSSQLNNDPYLLIQQQNPHQQSANAPSFQLKNQTSSQSQIGFKQRIDDEGRFHGSQLRSSSSMLPSLDHSPYQSKMKIQMSEQKKSKKYQQKLLSNLQQPKQIAKPSPLPTSITNSQNVQVPSLNQLKASYSRKLEEASGQNNEIQVKQIFGKHYRAQFERDAEIHGVKPPEQKGHRVVQIKKQNDYQEHGNDIYSYKQSQIAEKQLQADYDMRLTMSLTSFEEHLLKMGRIDEFNGSMQNNKAETSDTQSGIKIENQKFDSSQSLNTSHDKRFFSKKSKLQIINDGRFPVRKPIISKNYSQKALEHQQKTYQLLNTRNQQMLSQIQREFMESNSLGREYNSYQDKEQISTKEIGQNFNLNLNQITVQYQDSQIDAKTEDVVNANDLPQVAATNQMKSTLNKEDDEEKTVYVDKQEFKKPHFQYKNEKRPATLLTTQTNFNEFQTFDPQRNYSYSSTRQTFVGGSYQPSSLKESVRAADSNQQKPGDERTNERTQEADVSHHVALPEQQSQLQEEPIQSQLDVSNSKQPQNSRDANQSQIIMIKPIDLSNEGSIPKLQESFQTAKSRSYENLPWLAQQSKDMRNFNPISTTYPRLNNENDYFIDPLFSSYTLLANKKVRVSDVKRRQILAKLRRDHEQRDNGRMMKIDHSVMEKRKAPGQVNEVRRFSHAHSMDNNASTESNKDLQEVQKNDWSSGYFIYVKSIENHNDKRQQVDTKLQSRSSHDKRECNRQQY